MNESYMLSEQKVDEFLHLVDDVAKEWQRRSAFLLNVSEGLFYIRIHSGNRPPYTINVFERYNSDEPTTSWALAKILKYREGASFPLLNLFVRRFLVPLGFNLEWIETPHITAEDNRFDVCVRDNKYAILFENKVKGAGYQPNQLARYIRKLNITLGKHYDKENIFILLMPCSHDEDYLQNMPTSVWRLPEDFRKPKREQQCVIEHNLCWCDVERSDWKKQWNEDFCKSCVKTYRKDYGQHTLVLQRELADWLINDSLKAVPSKEIILKSFVVQFADFLNLQYGTRENHKLKREMEKYLREKMFDNEKSNIENWENINKRLKDIRKLEEELCNLLESISRDVIDDWYQELLPVWKGYGLRNEKRKSFGINVQGVLIGCWDGRGEDNHEQYWGFYSEKGFTQKQCKMIEAILEESGTSDYIKEKSNQWYWGYTCHGIERCCDFYNAAVDLGYLDKQE